MPGNIVLPMPLLAGMMAVPVVLLAAQRPIVRFFERDRPTRAGAAHAPRWLGGARRRRSSSSIRCSRSSPTPISFVRVAAFAAVHAGVFIAMFALTDTLSQLRFGQPLSIATLIVGNVLMILLEGLTVSVQVLRLEYYEFFGKFFRGGGELYRPLMLRKGGP